MANHNSHVVANSFAGLAEQINLLLRAVLLIALSIALLFLSSCSSKAAQPKQPSPVTVENAKLEIALAKGKQLHDKRATIKEREWSRDKARLLKDRR